MITLCRIFIFCMLICNISSAQNKERLIITSDIHNFWAAYDKLKDCSTKSDSIHTIQTMYLDKASQGLKLFIKARNFSAERYVDLLSKVPRFWSSIRSNTLQLEAYAEKINAIFDQYEAAYPGFKRPNVCFAIGQLSTGGTVKKDWLLIGSEIACADSTTDKSELGTWLRSVMQDQNNVLELIAHEAVHAQQKMGFGTIWGYFNHRLLTFTILEGGADFVAKNIAGITINQPIHGYGKENESTLWQEFSSIMYKNDLSQWLYNGSRSKDRPADLGYYIGYKICESYYNQAADKKKALKDIIEVSNYRRFYKKSKYPINKGH